MLSRLWVMLILCAAVAGICTALVQGSGAVINSMSEGMFESAKTGVEMSIGLIAAMALWLGVFQIAEAAGVASWLAKKTSAVVGRLMPDVPKDHPAMANVGINISMGMLGIDNGALPSALKAMEELEKLNNEPGMATRAQQMFLVYMTTSVTIFPISILGYRVAAGAAHPADVFMPLLIASYVGAFVGLAYMAVVQRIRLFDPVLIGGTAILIFVLASLSWAISSVAHINSYVTLFGNAVLLLTVVTFIAIAHFKGVLVFDAFLTGASKGFFIAIELIPYVVGMLVAIGLLRTSGAFAFLQQGLHFVFDASGLDTKWVHSIPQAIIKSFSGGGARAMMLDTFKVHGPDSFLGHLSAIIQGASDTTFYVLALCAGAAKIKNLGHAITGSVIADIASMATAIALAYYLF